MKGPREFPKGQGQSAQGDVAFGTRIAQALGFAGKVRGHLWQQIRLVKVEGLAQFELQRAAPSLFARQAKLEDGGRMTMKVGALRDGDKREAGLGGGCFKRSDEGGFQFSGHAGNPALEIDAELL